MKNKFKQFIALFLCALMVLTSGMFSIGANLAATDDAGSEYAEAEAEATADTASASSETTETAEPETTAAAEETAVPEETAEPTAETTAVPEETAAPEETAEAAASAEPAATAAPVKTEYDYSDNKVTVTATLSDPSIIPDDAVLKVTQVTKKSEDYNYDAYMDALNQSGASDEKEYTSKNTLLYDICFIETAADGTETEVEPAEGGSVSLNVVFNKDQLTDKLDAEKAEDVTVTHLPINDEAKAANNNMTAGADITASDISVEDVSASVSLGSTEQVDFSTDSFTVFAFKEAGGQKNTWNNGEGEGTPYTFSDILTGINQNDNVTNFAIYANELDSNQHLEGNVKVGKIKLGNVPLNQDSNVQTRNAVTAIHVTKTVDQEKKNERIFKFGVFKDNYEIYDFSITVPKNASSAEITLDSTNAPKVFSALENGNVTVYELDDKDSPVQEGGKNDSYTVHYSGNNVMSINSVSNYDNYIGSIVPLKNKADSVSVEPNTFDQERKGYTTYIEDFSDGQFEGVNGDYVFFSDGKKITLKNYKGYDPNGLYIKKGSGIKDKVSDTLDEMKEFSAQLADARNGAVKGTGSLSVINLISTTGSLQSDLEAANFNEPQNGNAIINTIKENGYLLINIDATKFDTYYLQQINIDGYNADNNDEELARHVIFNFVQKNDKKNGSTFEAYTGTVKVNNVTAGTVIAPAASYINEGGLRGMVIAKTVDRSNGTEIHKDSLTTQKTAQVTIANSEVKPGTLKITKNVTAYGEATTGNEADGTYSFTVKDANGNTAKDIDGKEVGNVSITITNGQSSTAVVNNLPAGKYTVSENTDNLPAGVSVVGNNFVDVTVMEGTTADRTQAVAAFTNNYENTTHIDIHGEKIWDDNNNQDGKRPTVITVNLMKETDDGSKVKVDSKRVTEKDNWSYTFSNLPEYYQGKKIKYSVEEDNVKNYQSSIDGYNITNTYKPGTTSVSVTKVWDDDNNQLNIRPDSVKVKLNAEADGKVVKLGNNLKPEVTLDAGNNWSHEWKDLPLKQNKEKIVYTVEEVNVPNGYSDSISGNAEKGFIITNTAKTAKVAAAIIHGTKTVEGLDDPRSVAGKFRFALYDSEDKEIDTAKNAANGTFSFAKLTYTKEGTYKYTVKEINAGRTIDGIKYSSDKDKYPVTVTVSEKEGKLTASVSNSVDVVNTKVKTLHVVKQWDDDNNANHTRPGSITVHLLENGIDKASAVLTADNNWSYDFTGLDPENRYTVTEVMDENNGYTSKQVVTDDGNKVTLINTFTKTVNLSAHKTLKGALIQNGEFTFKLVRKSDPDNAYYAVNNGSGDIFFNNIPYDESGYTVTEVSENGDPHITYDTGEITYDKDGNITGEKTEFINTERPAVLRVRKTSKEEPYDPLVGAVYGLYMAGKVGTNDVLVEAQTSDANGYMYYTKFQEGVWYYFKEISAPAGHEVDPYPGQKFEIKYQADGSLTLVGEDGKVISTADITDSTSTGTAAYVQINTAQTDLDSITADAGHVKLTSDSDGVKAVAVAVEGTLPEDTQLQVKKVNLSDAAEENLKKQIGEFKSVAYYDVSFISNRKKVEPEAGTVTVTIQEDNGTAIPSDVKTSNLKLVHLLDDQATGVSPVYGSIEVDGNTMHGTSVTSSSFSIFGVVEPEDMTAFGSNYLLTASGVSDKVSKVQIAKLDTAGKYVIGAELQIIEKNTGKVVAEWNTSKGNMVFNRFFRKDEEPLNVDTDYILHEVSAPEGYQKADDIVFRLNKYDSSLSIWRYDEKGRLVEDKKSEDEAVTDFTLTMTDKPIKVEKDKVYKQKTVHKDTVLYKNKEVTETITTTDKKGNKVTVTRYGTNTVNTGVANHTALYVTLIVIAAAAVIVITVLKNRNRKEAE